MTQEHPSLPSKQVIAPPRPVHATDRYDGPTVLYRLFDADDRLLYIGITCNTAQRWESHRGSKPWWHLVARKELTAYPDRSAALTAERAAIRAEAPLHNITGNPRSDRLDVHLVLKGERAEKLRALAKRRGLGFSNLVHSLIDEAPFPSEPLPPEPRPLGATTPAARKAGGAR